MIQKLHTGQSKKPIQLRLYNERRILQVLRRRGPLSKAEIARLLNLSNAAMGNIINSLADNDLVYLGEKVHQGSRGQPATLIHLNGTSVYSIGVQINRNQIETVLTDFDGNIISRINHEKLLPKPQQTINIVIKDIEKILSLLDSEKRKRLAGIGLAIPYNLNSWTEILDLPKDTFIHWKDYDFAKELEKATKIPVYRENDGTAAAIAALYYGVGRNINNFLYIYIGPGIGGGLVLHGEIIRGENNNAANIGSMPVPSSKLKSNKSSHNIFDILLNRASLNILLKHLKFNGINVDSFEELETVISSNNKYFQEWFDDTIEALTHLIWSTTTLLDISTIVIASSVDGSLTNKIKEKLDHTLNKNIPETCVAPKIITGNFGSDAGTIGAASLPFFYNFSPTKEILTEGLRT